ncbi:MAG: hypothetical protein H6577_02085 [Lewinellaceae bacterium]|nr:hypothetical protein [Lewinellaceae bacterium]
MQNSNLHQLIHSFSSLEQREVRKFLASPFFNTRDDLLLLYDFLVENKEASKESTWQHLVAGEPFDDQKLRLLMSYLHKLLEQYISIKEATADELSNRLHLAIGYRRRGMAVPFERVQKSLEKSLQAQPLRDAHFYQTQHRLQWEQYQVAAAQNPAEELPLKALSGTMDVYYLATRLRLLCLSMAQQGVYEAGFQSEGDDGVVAWAHRSAWKDAPAVVVYLHCYWMLRKPADEGHFQYFKKAILESGGFFGTEEMRGLYLLAINYCIRRLNDGDRNYFREVLELYKAGLASSHLLENGTLSRFTYHNIVAAGLQSEELEWVAFFINEYKNSLERKYRESSYSFSLARLEFSRRRYDAVLELLQKANYRDPLLNLAAKTLLLKTYHALDELDLLQSHLDAMRNYVRRKRVIGYHRTNYLNIVRYAEKLLKVNLLDNKAVGQLRAEITGEEVLTEREWLLACLEV